ncbi:MAG: prohibitin family protein [Thioploca sp.]|nr:prohibitin family protein [Thioploca sp.]
MNTLQSSLSSLPKKGFKYWLKDKVPYLVIIFLITLIIVILLFWRIFIIVHSGEAGVLYRLLTTGTETNRIYSEGYHLIWPWNTMTIYNMRVQTVLHELTVLTREGLPITLKLAIRFRPEYDMVALLHQNVGPDYVDKIIIPQIDSVLLRNIGNQTPEDVYSNKGGILTKIMVLAIEETSRKYVTVDDIIIRSVELPSLVRQAIEEKLVEEQVVQRYDYKLEIAQKEADRKKIEAEGIKTYQAIISETISESLIKWQAVNATEGLIKSNNAKIVIIGAGEQGLPVILGNQWGAPANSSAPATTPSASATGSSVSPAALSVSTTGSSVSPADPSASPPLTKQPAVNQATPQ